MNEQIVKLWSDLLSLVKLQREALSGGRLEEALELQERRQSIVDKIQKIDRNIPLSLQSTRSSVGKNGPPAEDFSRQIAMTVDKVLSMDNQIQTFLQSELISIAGKLHTIQKAKAFCHNTRHHQTQKHLQISA